MLSPEKYTLSSSRIHKTTRMWMGPTWLYVTSMQPLWENHLSGGMKAFEESFAIIKGSFRFRRARGKEERKKMLLCLIPLFNLYLRRIGINQILSTYMPHLGVETNLYLSKNLRILIM